ncbi:MAG: hypothetical protein KatS3mg014_2108 [Actinomycetota bacterium]|nr:MAG: hypothetical protein KatS3mg014_2108 [Actinomycetota bacterium]
MTCPRLEQRQQPPGVGPELEGDPDLGAQRGELHHAAPRDLQGAHPLRHAPLLAHDRAIEDRPPAVLHADHRRPSVAELVEAHALGLGRVVDPDLHPVQEPPVGVEERRPGHEVPRLTGRTVRGLEVVHPDPHAGVVLPEVPTLPDLAVVVGVRLGPGLALDDHRLAAEARPLPPGDPRQEQEDRPVEQEAPALPGEPLLGGEPELVPGRADPEPQAAEGPPRVPGSRARAAGGRAPRRSAAARRAPSRGRAGPARCAGRPGCAARCRRRARGGAGCTAA